MRKGRDFFFFPRNPPILAPLQNVVACCGRERKRVEGEAQQKSSRQPKVCLILVQTTILGNSVENWCKLRKRHKNPSTCLVRFTILFSFRNIWLKNDLFIIGLCKKLCILSCLYQGWNIFLHTQRVTLNSLKYICKFGWLSVLKNIFNVEGYNPYQPKGKGSSF